jgi:mono/diheme cytochrome c family protein
MKRIFFLLLLLGTIVLLTSFILQDNQWLAPSSATKKINPVESNEKSLKLGKKIYSSMCWTCHGVDGKGEGPAGISLNPKPADFTNLKFQNQTDGAIYWKLTTGKGTMISYENTLTEQQLWSVTNYLRTLKK